MAAKSRGENQGKATAFSRRRTFCKPTVSGVTCLCFAFTLCLTIMRGDQGVSLFGQSGSGVTTLSDNGNVLAGRKEGWWVTCQTSS